jgi:hypothetical protein
MSHDDFAVEAVPGLPAALPDGERLLWQGTPDWRGLAVRALHVRKVGIYFAVLMAWSGIEAQYLGQGTAAALFAAAGQLGLGLLACGLLAGFAWLIARSTIYSVTTERLVIRFGVALQFTINLPFAVVQAAELRSHKDGTGDIPIRLAPQHNVSYLLLWPHVRPWRVSKPEPMLRNVAEPQRVAAVLAAALQQFQQRRGTVTASQVDPDLPRVVRRAAATAAA